MAKEEIIEKSDNHFFRTLIFLLILSLILIIVYSRYLGTSGLFVKEYSIKDDNLPASFNNLKIAHFSDLHYGRTTDLKDIKELVNRINDKKVDIAIFTGDFFDKNYKLTEKEMGSIAEELSKINTNYGKFYIDGETDIKFNEYETLMTNSGFESLNGSFTVLLSKKNEGIYLAGINYKNSSQEFLEGYSNYSFKILIMHEPDEIEDFIGYGFDLALAGHSHNNQINIPYIKKLYSKKGAVKYSDPYYKIDNTDLYISSGIGTSDYSFRLFNRPSFNIYKIKNHA